ncbi:MAG: restriction endonuclease subunit S [Chloroherpetonaceae bacterium]
MIDQKTTIPKGWKMTTLGEIPESWQLTTAEKFCLKVADGTHATPKPVLNGRYLVTSKHIKSGKVDLTSAYLISQNDFEEVNKRSKVDQWDVLFSMIGTVGEIAIIDKDPDFAIKNVGLFKCGSEYKAKWLFYFLRGKIGQGEIQRRMNGTTQSYVTLGDLRSFPVIVPSSADELKAIAAVLSSLDDKIELLREQNKTLEATAQAIFRKWFVEKAKEDWEEGELEDILSVIESGKRPKSGIDPNLVEGYPSIGAESINGIGNFSFNSTKFITADFFQSLKNGVANDFDVLIYKDGAYIGKKAMFGLGFPFEKFAINEHVFILRSNEKANQFFLYFLLQQDELAMLNANSAQPGLNQQSMKSFSIIIPPKNLIDEFGSIAKSFVEKILKNAGQIRTLENLRNALLPKLMRGEVRVKGFRE